MSIDPADIACKPKRTGRFQSGWACLVAVLAFGGLVRPAVSSAQPARPPGIPACFEYKTLPPRNGQTYAYLLYLPKQYDDDKNHRWPVIVSLHGSGECGNVAAMAGMAVPRYVASRPDKFPFIVVAVNAPTMWYRGNNAAAVLEILNEVAAHHRIDPDRIYLTGYSMGGFGTWEIAIARPDLFAAIVPVCGIGIPAAAGNIASLPTWAFHGAKDANVPVAGSRQMIEAMKKAGGHPRYTEYPSLAHEIWEGVYGNMGVYKWLLEQRRPAPPKVIDYTLVGPAAQVWWLTVVAEPGATLPHVRATIEDDGRINITSKGIGQWLIESNGPPLMPGQTVDLSWNGTSIYKGVFQGTMGIQPATQPASAPAVATSQPARP